MPPPEDPRTTSLLGIGELASRSGLTVSALRFYDQEGVLVPHEVDPSSGYRRYGAAQVTAARLVAGLRRVGLPVADIAVAVEQLGAGEDESVLAVLAEHGRRLEAGLRDARRELARLERLVLDRRAAPGSVGLTVDGGALVAALRDVRFAVGTDPAHPVLHGVLLTTLAGDPTAGPSPVLEVVATDRYRMAVARVAPLGGATASPPPAVDVVAPVSWVDELVSDAPSGPVRLTVSPSADDGATRLLAEAVGAPGGAGTPDAPAAPDRWSAAAVVGEYPDHRRVLEHLRGDGGGGGGVGDEDAAGLADLVRAAEPVLSPEGRRLYLLRPAPDDAAADHDGSGQDRPVAVDAEFLLQALDAAGPRPVLRLDGPVSPLVVRRDADHWSVLMPTSLTAGAGR